MVPRLPLTRRTLLAGFAGLAGSGVASGLHADELAEIRAVPSLAVIAAQRGLLFGSAISQDTLVFPSQAELYRHQAGLFTTDTALKFAALRPQEGPANFDAADELVAFAAAAGIPMRGHTLIWNEWNPDWVNKLSGDRCAYWFDRHIDEVVGRYAGRLHSWDVVNEPFWPDHGNRGGFRSGPWYSAMGPNYVVRAMKRAQAADPTARLAINEAGPEWERSWGSSATRMREELLGLIDTVQQAGARLDLVGLQCHWFGNFTFDAGRFQATLHALAEKVPSLVLSEIDVHDTRLTGTMAEVDAVVAARYGQLITAALAEPKVEALITWQLSDRASWLIGSPNLWGPGGREPRPLPFDRDMRPKAAYYAIAAALEPVR